jgi:hypothetical protein
MAGPAAWFKIEFNSVLLAGVYDPPRHRRAFMILKHPSHGFSPTKGLADIPAVDDPECFAAHVRLAILSCHLHLADIARLHLSGALDILVESATQTMRSSAPSMLVRVHTRAHDDTATLTLPCIGGEAIAPRVALAQILPALRDTTLQGIAVELTDVGIEFFRLRVRTGRMQVALKQLTTLTCLADLADALENILAQCSVPAPAAAPLEMAHGYFMLARHFSRAGNGALAGLALQKAGMQVETYGGATGIESHRAKSHALREKIDKLAEQKGSLLF